MTERRRGLFLNFEGMDGSGKSTQMRLVAARLREQGREVVETVEPGGTRIGDQIRRILLDPAHLELSPTAEMLLYFAARAQNVDERILPALGAGKIVLTDRFTDSTMAYQGMARGLGEEPVLALDRIACRGLRPDLTLCFDIDPETSLRRAHARNREHAHADRMDSEAFDFHRRVRDAYRAMAAREPERFRLVDGRPDPASVFAEVWAAVSGLLARGG